MRSAKTAGGMSTTPNVLSTTRILIRSSAKARSGGSRDPPFKDPAQLVDYQPMTGEQPLPSALVRGIEQLEPMPVTAQRLLALMNGEDVSLASIAELVEFDQAIAAAVLRMARSWAYAGSRPPETVRDAVCVWDGAAAEHGARATTSPASRPRRRSTTSAKTTSGPTPRRRTGRAGDHAGVSRRRSFRGHVDGGTAPRHRKLVMSRCLNAASRPSSRTPRRGSSSSRPTAVFGADAGDRPAPARADERGSGVARQDRRARGVRSASATVRPSATRRRLPSGREVRAG